MKNFAKKISFAIAAGSLLAVNLFWSLPAAAQSPQPAYRYTQIPVVSANSSAQGSAMATDASGASYEGGDFNGTVNFAGSSGNDSVTTPYGTAYLSKHNHDGSYAWTRTIDTSANGSAEVTAVATDPSGNVYLVGAFSGGVTLDGPGGTDTQNITGGGTFINKYSSNGSYEWSKTIIPPPNGGGNAYGIAIDSAGNIYLAGNFQDTVNFAATDGGTDNQTAAGGNGDVFLTRFNANGSYGWTKVFDVSNGDAGDNGLAIDPAGDLYLTGYFSGTVNFAGGSGTDNQTDTSGNGSVFVTKFNTAGSYGWTRAINSTANDYAGSTSIAADPSGNVYITGYLDGSINFAGTSGNDTQTDAGGSGDTFVTKYTPGGGYGWTKTFDTSPGGSGFGQAIATDENGDLYVVSTLHGSINFAGTSGNDTQTENSSGALTMYTPGGGYAWTKVFDTTNGTAVTTQGLYAGITADPLGDIYLTSIFTGTVGFDGPGGSDSQTAGGYNSAFLTSYKTFDPAAVVAPTTSPTATIKAPDTGFATSHQSYRVIILCVTVSLTCYSVSLTIRRVRLFTE